MYLQVAVTKEPEMYFEHPDKAITPAIVITVVVTALVVRRLERLDATVTYLALMKSNHEGLLCCAQATTCIHKLRTPKYLQDKYTHMYMYMCNITSSKIRIQNY